MPLFMDGHLQIYIVSRREEMGQDGQMSTPGSI